MSKSDIAVSVRGLSKSYAIGVDRRQKQSTLAEALVARLCSPFQKQSVQSFTALEDVSFDIKAGEVVGIIGRNGAGKSTLLKILSRITEPTAGRIDLYGRVGSLLEVGTGFHPELTGRENIYLNGAILGMNKAEIRREFDAIVEFAGVELFLDTPVKRYSSGMYVRLAFAVAAHLRSEILVIDEVLAVGDVEFQRKCLGKMKDVATGGRTVLFVSHHMQSITALCTQALLLDKGVLAHMGDVSEAVLLYARAGSRPGLSHESLSPTRRRGTGEYRITAMNATSEFFACAGEKSIEVKIERFRQWRGRIDLIFLLRDERDVVIAQCDSRLLALDLQASEQFEITFKIRSPWLKPGLYRVDAYVCGSTAMDEFPDACSFEVLAEYPYPDASCPQALEHGVALADFSISPRKIDNMIHILEDPSSVAFAP